VLDKTAPDKTVLDKTVLDKIVLDKIELEKTVFGEALLLPCTVLFAKWIE
jgi:hypothetical protein